MQLSGLEQFSSLHINLQIVFTYLSVVSYSERHRLSYWLGQVSGTRRGITINVFDHEIVGVYARIFEEVIPNRNVWKGTKKPDLFSVVSPLEKTLDSYRKFISVEVLNQRLAGNL